MPRSLGYASAAALCLVSLMPVTQALGAEPSPRSPADTCVPARIPFAADDIRLTGRWSADDGGMYYIRQVGDAIWWNGMSDYAQIYDEIGRDWNNVGKGTLRDDLISMEYAHVPRGNIWGSAAISLKVEPDANGDLQIRRTSGDFGASLFTPCEPAVHTLDGFARPFSFTDTFGEPSDYWRGVTNQAVMFSPEVPDSGMTAWVLGPGFQRTCSSPEDFGPLAPGPQGLIDYLRTVPDLAVGEASEVTVDGRPALSVDVTTKSDLPEATACGEDWVRLWKESGLDGGIGLGQTSRIIALDVEGATVAFEIFGPALDLWAPGAQLILDTIRFDPAAALDETIGQPADDGARIVKVDVLDERYRDLTIESPSVGYAKVRLLLPTDFEDQPATRWPTLYLLDGAGDEHTVWSRETEVEKVTAGKDLLVAMSAASGGGAFGDWWQGGKGGQPAWETFHTQELPQLLERNWQAGDTRAIAGSSMGGLGAMIYAARNPGMFKAAAAYSGIVDTSGPENQMDPAVWGDKTEQADNWKAHNPLDVAEGLEGTALYVSYGNGVSGPFDAETQSTGVTDDLEARIATMNEGFVARLGELGIPVTVNAYGDGTHSWRYFDREFQHSLPMLLEALGVAP